MKARTRFIKSIIATSKHCDTPLPWARNSKPTPPQAPVSLPLRKSA